MSYKSGELGAPLRIFKGSEKLLKEPKVGTMALFVKFCQRSNFLVLVKRLVSITHRFRSQGGPKVSSVHLKLGHLNCPKYHQIICNLHYFPLIPLYKHIIQLHLTFVELIPYNRIVSGRGC